MINEKYGYIKGISEKRRLPLLGKIRLGIKKVSEKSGKEYPAETDYFVITDEIKKIYGDKPKEIDILLPVAARHIIFPTAYRYYGQSRGLKCLGNGEVASEWSDDKKSLVERICPCNKLELKQCNKRAFLMAILPKVSMGGVYQISTGAFNSIVDINSGLDYIEALIGRIQMVPLKLKREPITTNFEGKKQIHYTMKIIFDGTAEFINQLRENTKRILFEEKLVALPAPEDENPACDDGAIKEYVDEEKKEEHKNIKFLTPEHQATIKTMGKTNQITWNNVVVFLKETYPHIKIKSFEETPDELFESIVSFITGK